MTPGSGNGEDCDCRRVLVVDKVTLGGSFFVSNDMYP
jgi:hypothetical protein